MSKLLVLHPSSELYGSDRSVLSFLKAVNQRLRGCTVQVVTPDHGALVEVLLQMNLKVEFQPLGILRRSIFKSPVSFVWGVAQSFRFYVSLFRKYDIVYINTAVMFSALLASRFASDKTRVICHVREIPGSNEIWFFRWLLRVARVDLIFNSEATKNAFQLPGEVVYNGVPEVGDSLRRDVDDQSTGFCRLLVIGRINSWKGQDLLLKALCLINEGERDKFRIRIVGGVYGEDNRSLERLHRIVSNNNLRSIVQFYDFTNDPGEHFLWADWVVVPSTKPEPFGRVAIEAFAYGKPVVAARHGGLTEIVTHGMDGFLFEANSVTGLCDVIDHCRGLDISTYEALCSKALIKFVSQFSEVAYQQNLCRLVFRDAI